MKKTFSALALAAISAVPALSQLSGVSHPDESPITASAEPAPSRIKPSAAIAAERLNTTTASTETYGAYVPYTGPKSSTAAEAPLTEAQADASVVTTVVDRPGELREGTLLHARLSSKLSTATTEPGTRFTAQLVDPIEKEGRIILPVGSAVQGRVTSVHSGRRISGAALIHLEADTIVLPDGTRYSAHLQLIDTNQTNSTKIDHEGSLVRRDHPKETLAAVGLATGASAVAGGMIGGGVGAAVGAGIGAGVGTIVWLKESRQEVVPEDTVLIFSLATPMPLTPQTATARGFTPHAVTNPDAKVAGDN